MMDLKDSNPNLYRSFEAGHNVFRRSNHFWAGLCKDLMIEQVGMKSQKTGGGLKTGAGLRENQRTMWLLLMQACAQVSAACNHFQSHLLRLVTGTRNQQKQG